MANYKKQMEMFDLGGLKDQGETVDRKSRNKVPVGSLKKEVRDDVPINISEGEFVLPADVVRYHGLEKIMNMRQDAKAGLNMMNKMGQMGNSDQATLPDDIPFQPKNFQQGGVNIQNPQVQNPQIIPDVQQTNQVPGVTFTPPVAPVLRPSIYSQKATMPNVGVPPKVDIPKQTTYKPPQYTTPTGTAATPDFSKLIGTRFGQLQKSETKKYVNPETGEELFIPFVSGEPVYPIPEGYVFEADVEKEKEKEKPTEAIKTTRVMQDDGGSDDVFTMGDTGVQSTLTSDQKRILEDERRMQQGQLGAANYKAPGTLSRIFKDVKADLGAGFKGIFSFIGDTFAPAKAKEITPELQDKRAKGLGFDGINAILEQLGLKESKTNLSVGHSPGSVSPFDTKSVYNSKGLLVNLDRNSLDYGGSKRDSSGVPIRANKQGFIQDLKDMYNTGWAGGYTGLGASATLSDEARRKENAYRAATGMPSLPDRDSALKELAKFNTGYNLEPNRDTSKDIYVREDGGGVVTGGTWTRNSRGELQYNMGPGRGTIVAGKSGKLGDFKTTKIGLRGDPIIGKPTPDITGLIKETPTKGMFSPDTADASSSPRTTSVDLAPAGADFEGSTELASQYADDPSSVQGEPSGGFGETGTTSEPGGYSSTGDFGFTAEGGFISRRRASKIKKKLGGLASR
jgi:hypothetical protein